MGAHAPVGDDALQEERLCTVIRRYWSAKGYYAVAMEIHALTLSELPAKTYQQRLFVIRSNLRNAMPSEMGGRWRIERFKDAR